MPYGAPCPIPGAINSVVCNDVSCTVLQPLISPVPSACVVPPSCGWRGVF
jgi:hypothetical protein